ncbi:MAG TPA: S8 family serine peptidase [Thermoanaerobaculia bacterium]|nr:S8 family serine peptidase [Thermoanaerobaculia bacterium]
MRRAVAIAALLLFPVLASAATERYVVALKGGGPALRGALLLRDIDSSIGPRERAVASFRNLDAFAADLTESEVAALRLSPGVRYVEPVAERRILGFPGAPATDASRNVDGQTIPAGVDTVRAREVWAVTRGEAANVVVIDTGVDYRHPDLASVWAGGFNAITQSADPMDDHSHGTHVSGTIAAADNDFGVVGVAPRVRLWGVKALRADGGGTSDRVIAGIDWVIGQKKALGGNWIINLSLGAARQVVAEREAIARAVNEGILVVAASGNESTSALPAPVSFPAAYPGVLAIGAVDGQLQHASFSNRGPELGAVAPGVDILSSVRTGTGSLSAVLSAEVNYVGAGLAGSPRGTVSGPFTFCGVGREQDFTAAVAGRIAVIRRGGEITFALKAKRAKAAGATAVVIVNHDSSPLNFTLLDPNDPTSSSFDWPVTIALSNADGDHLIASSTPAITVKNVNDDYESNTGTSMAAPHAAGVAALAWSVAPAATAAEVRNALIMQATDLGAPGFDTLYGHGLLNALESAKMLNPAAFGSPSTPPSDPEPSGRRILRRGRG